MKPPRFSLARSLAAVAALAVAFASMRGPTRLWASVLFTTAWGSVLLAALLAAARSGRPRLSSAGYASFCGASLFISFVPWGWMNPEGLRPPEPIVAVAVDALRWHPALGLNRANGPWMNHYSSIHWSGHEPNAQIHPRDVGFASPGGQFVQFDVSPYKQVAHSLAALGLGWLGSWLARIAAPRATDSK